MGKLFNDTIVATFVVVCFALHVLTTTAQPTKDDLKNCTVVEINEEGSSPRCVSTININDEIDKYYENLRKCISEKINKAEGVSRQCLDTVKYINDASKELSNRDIKECIDEFPNANRCTNSELLGKLTPAGPVCVQEYVELRSSCEPAPAPEPPLV